MTTINIWAIIISTLVAFGISAIWYSPWLFGKEWMTLIKMTDKDTSSIRSTNLWGSYIIHLIISIVTFIIIAFAISMTDSSGTSNGAFIGFLAWLGFVLPINISETIWEKRPFKLLLINTINILLSLVIGGAIIGGWN